MLYSVMQTMVQDLAGDANQVQFTLTQIQRYLNLAQREIAQRTESVLREATITSLDSSGLAAVPADFIRPVNLRWAGKFLTPMDRDYLQPVGESLVASPNTAPDAFWIDGTLQTSATARAKRIHFYPHQVGSLSGLNIQMLYVAYPLDLSAGTDVSGLPEELHEIVVYRALAHCKVQEGDYQGAAFIMKDVENRIAMSTWTHGPATYDSYGAVRSGEEVRADYDNRV